VPAPFVWSRWVSCTTRHAASYQKVVFRSARSALRQIVREVVHARVTGICRDLRGKFSI
jgi:hypothetical protein